MITTFRNDEEAIALASATDYGLVAAVVSADLARAQRVADGLHAGAVHINDQTVVHGVYGSAVWAPPGTAPVTAR